MRTLILTVAALAAACRTELKPGRCEKTNDCSPGLLCNLDRTPQGNGRCVPACSNAADCQDGRVCDFGATGAGRCLFPQAPDGGGGDGDDAGGRGADGTGGVFGTGGAGGAAGIGGAGGNRQCSAHAECPAGRPACSGQGMCVSCNTEPGVCVARDPGRPACGPNGRCVECAWDANCSVDLAKPVCNLAMNACERCTRDAQCAAKSGPDPGVCMAHQNGRCATVAETIFVENKAGCAMGSTDPNAGTAGAPFCRMQEAVALVLGQQGRRLVVVRGTVQAGDSAFAGVQGQVTIVGQRNGSVVGGTAAGLLVDRSDVFARDLSLVRGDFGAVARNGSTLRLEHVSVDQNGGGILVDSSGIEVINSTVARNGPATTAAVTWGGILVQNPTAAMPSRLHLVTVTDNRQVGVACSSAVTGTGVFAAGNSGGVEISPTCGITPCSTPGPECGAQP